MERKLYDLTGRSNPPLVCSLPFQSVAAESSASGKTAENKDADDDVETMSKETIAGLTEKVPFGVYTKSNSFLLIPACS